MAGGKATRMKRKEEKPLLKIGDRTMLELVVNSLKQSNLVNQIIVSVSANTPQTALAAKSLLAQVIETPGAGYVSDMQYAIAKLHLGETLVVSADLPFLTSEIVDKAIEAFRSCKKPSLSVMAPSAVYEEMGSKPEHVFRFQGQDLVPTGLNLIDGTRIREPELDQALLVLDSKALALNVNAPSDYELAKELERTRRITARE